MSWRSFCTALHLTALGLWAGSVAISAATAAVAFPTLHGMDIRIKGLPEASQEDAFRFAAGAVAQRVFLIADIVAFACAMIGGVTLLGLFFVGGLARNRTGTYIRCLAFAVALASLAAILFVVTPGITSAFKDHLAAAKAGDVAAATLARQAATDLHPLSTNLLVVEFLAATIALFLGAWSAGGARASEPAKTGSPPSTYPAPDLLKHKRA